MPTDFSLVLARERGVTVTMARWQQLYLEEGLKITQLMGLPKNGPKNDTNVRCVKKLHHVQVKGWLLSARRNPQRREDRTLQHPLVRDHSLTGWVRKRQEHTSLSAPQPW